MWKVPVTMGCLAALAISGCQLPNRSTGADQLTNKPGRTNAEVSLGELRSETASPPPSSESSSIQLVQAQIPELSAPAADPRAPGSPAPPRGELQPGAGEVFLAPPAIPPVPETMETLESAGLVTAEQQPITLETLEELACANNPTLVQAKAQVQGTLGQAIQAGLWPNPVVFYLQDQIGLAGTPGEFLGGKVRQEIPTAHKLQLSRAKFLARTRVSEWTALAQEWQVLNDVRIHYFRTLGRQEFVEVQKELLKNAEDDLVTRREEYNIGRATRADLHLANVALQQQRLTLLAAENTLRRSWQNLTALAGTDIPFQPLAGTLESHVAPIDWDTALNRIMAEAPQLQQARINIQTNELQVERELVEPVPNIFVEGGAGYNFEPSARQSVGQVQVFMEVPLWDKNQGTIRQARSDLARQRAEVRRIELLLRQQLADVYDRYLTALQHVHNFEQVILPEARRAYEVRLDSYEDDRQQWDEVLLAENGYFLLRGQYIENLITLRESEVLIIGYLLHGGLAVPERPAAIQHIDVRAKPR